MYGLLIAQQERSVSGNTDRSFGAIMDASASELGVVLSSSDENPFVSVDDSQKCGKQKGKGSERQRGECREDRSGGDGGSAKEELEEGDEEEQRGEGEGDGEEKGGGELQQGQQDDDDDSLAESFLSNLVIGGSATLSGISCDPSSCSTENRDSKDDDLDCLDDDDDDVDSILEDMDMNLNASGLQGLGVEADSNKQNDAASKNIGGAVLIGHINMNADDDHASASIAGSAISTERINLHNRRNSESSPVKAPDASISSVSESIEPFKYHSLTKNKNAKTFYGNAAARKLGAEKGWNLDEAKTAAVADANNAPNAASSPVFTRKKGGRMSAFPGPANSPKKFAAVVNDSFGPPRDSKHVRKLSVATRARLEAEGKLTLAMLAHSTELEQEQSANPSLVADNVKKLSVATRARLEAEGKLPQSMEFENA